MISEQKQWVKSKLQGMQSPTAEIADKKQEKQCVNFDILLTRFHSEKWN